MWLYFLLDPWFHGRPGAIPGAGAEHVRLHPHQKNPWCFRAGRFALAGGYRFSKTRASCSQNLTGPNDDSTRSTTSPRASAALVAVIARLLPKDFQVTVAGAVQATPELTPEQRQRIAEAWMLSQQARPAIAAEID